ncbi:MAG: 4-hydroxy-tetrahydrodipicolinate synthase [Deltaproteobacteria bacterium]|nr:4-hydroxy-tetrahydrodipicolinate synthase [Deltaproteobacteria bacterium]MCB9785425.1 4-hydroxy-tetrahydrodipicolinate synthase [Deltaproteobacteria bacterium]
MPFDPRGVMTALATPFAADGSIDFDAWRALCERQVQAGAALVPCGTTGETPTLTHEEDARLIATAVEVAAGRVPVLAGTGSNATRTAIANTRRAAELGADAALVVTPYYNKPPQASLLAHYRAVADEGGLPVVLYHVPGRTACRMTPDTILRLAEHPRVVAIKEASADLDLLQEVISGAPPDFGILSGDDAWTLTTLLLGGHGVVSVASNVVPRAMVRLVRAACAGDLGGARALQKRLLPLFRALFVTTNPIPVKRALALGGYMGESVRLPLTADALDAAGLAALRSALELALAAEAEG